MIGKTGVDILQEIALTGQAVVISTHKTRSWDELQKLIKLGLVHISKNTETFVIVKFGRGILEVSTNA